MTAFLAVEVNTHVMHQAVVQYLANKRQGTQSALTRAEVRGGGRKPWRQKGTGRAETGFNTFTTVDWRWCCIRSKGPRDYSFNA